MGNTTRTRVVIVAAALVVAACSSNAATPAASTSAAPSAAGSASQYSVANPYKAAWIYVGSANDAGWTKAHDQGRLFAQQQLGDSVVTTYKENIPEGPQVAQVIDDLVSSGNNLIFATSYGFQPAMVDAAKKYPKVLFEQATGDQTATNLSEYFGAAENGDYLSGMAAGFASKSGSIGFVAPFPIPEVIREIDAFTMGARYARPGATVRVVWTNTWFDPAKERQAAQSLVSAGVDVLGDGQDSPTTGQVAAAAGLKWTGYDSDQTSFAPDAWLTATTYNWGPYYLNELKAAMAGTWKSQFYYGSLADGLIVMAPFGKSVTADARAAITKRQSEMVAGTFDPFSGPLTDQNGNTVVAAGTTLTVQQKYALDWFSEGVIGSPKG